MSWLSEWWRKLTNNPKVPAELSARKIICNQLSVVGPGGHCEIVAGTNGVRLTLMSAAKELKGNYWNVFAKANGEVSLDFVGPDGTVKAAIDMAPDGTILNRIPPP